MLTIRVPLRSLTVMLTALVTVHLRSLVTTGHPGSAAYACHAYSSCCSQLSALNSHRVPNTGHKGS